MIIQDLFEKRTQLMINCLRYIYQSNSFVTIVNLSERLNVNRKTTDSILNELQKIDPRAIQIKKALGCSFSGDKNVYFDIQHEIYNQSVIYQVIEHCLLSKRIKIEEFCELNYISLSNLRKKFYCINQSLERFELKIGTKNRRIVIEGSESQIRYFGHSFFWTICKGGQWPYSELNYAHIKELFVQRILPNFDFNLKESIIDKWCYLIALNILRDKKGNRLKKKELPQWSINMTQDLFEKEFQNIKGSFFQYSFFRDESIYFLFLMLQTSTQFYAKKTTYKPIIDFWEREKDPVYLEAVTLSEKLTLPLNGGNEKNVFGILLAAHSFYDAFDGFLEVGSDSEIIRYYRHYYPVLVNKIRSICFGNTTGKLTEKQEYLLLRYVLAYTSLITPTLFEKKIVVSVETDFPYSFELFFITQLKKIFSALYNVDFIAAESLVEEPDIIISNTYQNRSAIYMSGAINSLEIERLTKKIESIRRDHILQENVIVFSQQVVSAVFETHEITQDVSVQ
ncbi:helix-turn-helix domain-containing protein [Enterococcus sp.]|uniref:helix-turn-helix domain-containing protein n=1 Tax=Enterococcus sp. TaxID=35783 RepID=UPI0025C13A97|nr:helix-turn-helix domain-containing protein [Enterococcus sp.]